MRPRRNRLGRGDQPLQHTERMRRASMRPRRNRLGRAAYVAACGAKAKLQ